MNQPIKGLQALGAAVEARTETRTDTTKDLGHLTINAGGVYYVFPANSGLFVLDRKFTYNFDRQGVLRIIPTGDRTGYRVCRHPTKSLYLTLQLARRTEPDFGHFPAPRGYSKVLSIDVENSGWHRFTLGEEERPPIRIPSRRAPDKQPASTGEVQGFRERLKAAQECLNAAKVELGDDMQMRVDDRGQLRVVVMLEI